MSGLVLLIRHGETPFNKGDERVRGQLDMPLDAHGFKEAEGIARRLADRCDVEHVVTSPMRRALETAKLVSRATGAPYDVVHELRSWNMGDLAGKLRKDVQSEIERLARNPDQAPPNGESYNSFARSFLPALHRLLEQVANSGECIAAVTHTRNTQCARGWVAAGCKRDWSFDADVVNDYDHEIEPGQWLPLKVA